MSRTRLSVLSALCTVATLLAAGCGATTENPAEQGGDGANTTECTPGEPSDVADPKPLDADVAADTALGGQVPANITADGKIVIATDASYAPNEFTLEGSDEIIGMDVDLGKAIGKMLGVKVEFVNASFDGILAGTAGRPLRPRHVVVHRQQGTREDGRLRHLLQGRHSTDGRKCNPKGIKTADDLCGKKVGVEKGTTQIDGAAGDVDGSVVKACKDAGKAAPIAQGFPKQTDVNAALRRQPHRRLHGRHARSSPTR